VQNTIINMRTIITIDDYDAINQRITIGSFDDMVLAFKSIAMMCGFDQERIDEQILTSNEAAAMRDFYAN